MINRGQGRLGEAAPAMIQAGEDSESEEQTLGQREVIRFWTCFEVQPGESPDGVAMQYEREEPKQI